MSRPSSSTLVLGLGIVFWVLKKTGSRRHASGCLVFDYGYCQGHPELDRLLITLDMCRMGGEAEIDVQCLDEARALFISRRPLGLRLSVSTNRNPCKLVDYLTFECLSLSTLLNLKRAYSTIFDPLSNGPLDWGCQITYIPLQQ